LPAQNQIRSLYVRVPEHDTICTHRTTDNEAERHGRQAKKAQGYKLHRPLAWIISSVSCNRQMKTVAKKQIHSEDVQFLNLRLSADHEMLDTPICLPLDWTLGPRFFSACDRTMTPAAVMASTTMIPASMLSLLALSDL
jgi:hypothetical protein